MYQRLCGGCDIETGEGEAEGSGGLEERNNQKWDAFPFRHASHSFLPILFYLFAGFTFRQLKFLCNPFYSLGQ